MDKTPHELIAALRAGTLDEQQIHDFIESVRKTEKSKSLDQFFDLSSDLMCIMDRNGRLHKVSNSFGQALGYSQEELLFHSITEFIPDQDKMSASEALVNFRKGASNIRFESRFRSKSGHPHWFSWRAAALPEENLALVTARDVTAQKESIERLKNFSAQLHEHQREHEQSLRYASMLQEAIMPDPQSLKRFFPDAFVLFQPRNIVSGDFFWFDNYGDKIFIAAADCTGHGVPGALLSILGINTLHSALHSGNFLSTADLLKQLDMTFDRYLGRKFGMKTMTDGMDISICMIDQTEKVLHFSGVNNAVYVVRDQELIRLDASRYSLGTNHPDFAPATRTMELRENDMIYMLSDGYSDQFGGADNRKFGQRRLRELFVSLSGKPTSVQETEFINTWENWKGNEEQTDDVMLLGIQI
jgi:PAS domain S-box-containing protein